MPTQPYMLAGERVPGVTTILRLLGENKQALVHSAWKLGKEGRDYREEWGKAATAGTLGHAFAEAYVTHGPPPDLTGLDEVVVAAARERFDEFMRWLDGGAFAPIDSEIAIVSPTLRVGGTLDLVGTLHGEPALVDLKSRTLYKDQVIQVAAYRMLWDEAHPDVKIKSVHILGMTDGFHHHRIPEEQLEAGERCFRSLLALYGDIKQIKV